MPSKKKKYNARFPAGRIKKIMQSDEEIGKVAQAVPVIIFASAYLPRTLELFVESLLTKTLKITNSRNAKTLSPSHMKQCIMSEQRFDFLRELVKTVPDINVAEEALNYNELDEAQSSTDEQYPDSDTPYDLSITSKSATKGTQSSRYNKPSTSANGAGTSTSSSSSSYMRSQSLNGKNFTITTATANANPNVSSNISLKREYEPIPRLSITTDSRGITKSTVITHTATALANAGIGQLPSKLSRSESTPANALSTYYQRPPRTKNSPTSTITSASAGTGGVGSTLYGSSSSNSSSSSGSSCTNSNNSSRLSSVSQPIKRRTQLEIETAIPAPIVNYELNKPIVKIDYSNLQMPITTSPLSAPANFDATHIGHSGGSNSSSSNSNSNSSGSSNAITAFDFSAAPVINIDLSNIVTNVAAAAAATTAKSTHCTPAIATISIGTAPLPQTVEKLKIATSPIGPLAGCSSNSTSFIPAAKPAATTANDTFFELDEDYDNI